MDSHQVLNPNAQDEDHALEAVAGRKSLRPVFIRDYIGQEKIKARLSLCIQAARQRGDSLDHVLLSGPPGLGKTTLASIVAREMGSSLHTVAGPNIEKKGDLAALLSNLEPHDVLFIDEIHRLQRPIEEVLYGAMEDFKLDLILGQGPQTRTLKIDLPKFTLVGATTRSGLLTGPLRDRFGLQFHFDFYPVDEIEQIVSRSAILLDVNLEPAGAKEIARRSRGTPRIANRLLSRVRDFAQVRASNIAAPIDKAVAAAALELFEIDAKGLDAMDRRLLETIIDKFDGGPVGIETLSAALCEERDTIEEIHEPYLVQQGFLQRTPKGRTASRATYVHLGRALPPKNFAFIME